VSLMLQPVIFLPGIMGSVLKLKDAVIWPGTPLSVLLPYNLMSELMRPDLRATEVWRSLGPLGIYDSILRDLENWGFVTDQLLFPFPYDWRKSNRDAAGTLADLIDTVAARDQDNTKITLLAHSMGGLVARYYLESGKFAGRPGFGKVRSLITMGTPHRGAPLALTAGIGKEKRVFLSASQVLQLASSPLFPAVYELLPPVGEPFLWDVVDKLNPRDVYSKEISTAPGGLNLSAENLQAAITFREGLDFSRKPSAVRYFCFFGTDHPTPNYLELREGARFLVRAITVDGAGDGTVPIWSGQPNGVQSVPVPGEHSKLFCSSALRNILAELLGAPRLLAAAAAPTELSLSPKVVEPGDPIHVTLLLPGTAATIQGAITIYRLEVDGSGAETAENEFGKPISVEYAGGNAEALTITFDAPNLKGYYRARFRGANMEPSEDEFVVQDPEIKL
jgi:pimeloyl-ACP methyl ester carboxylesterase